MEELAIAERLNRTGAPSSIWYVQVLDGRLIPHSSALRARGSPPLRSHAATRECTTPPSP